MFVAWNLGACSLLGSHFCYISCAQLLEHYNICMKEIMSAGCTFKCLQLFTRFLITYTIISINQSINGFECIMCGHTRTQSQAALYKINNEVANSGLVASDYKHVGLSECEVMDDTWYVCQVSPYFCTNLAVHSFSTPLAMDSFLHAKSRIHANFLSSSTSIIYAWRNLCQQDVHLSAYNCSPDSHHVVCIMCTYLQLACQILTAFNHSWPQCATKISYRNTF